VGGGVLWNKVINIRVALYMWNFLTEKLFVSL